MFRIHLTADDLTHIRITQTYGPLAETIFGLALATLRPRALVNDWQRRTLQAGGHWNRPTVQVAELCGQLDLITLAGTAQSLDEGLEALVAVRPDHFRAEIAASLDLLAVQARRDGRSDAGRPHWWSLGRDVSDDRTTRHELAGMLRTCAEATVGPYWDGIRGVLAQEVARRSQQLAAEGLGRVLATLHPDLRWNSPVLELDWGGPDSSDLHLRGRGLDLVPSVFYREVTPPYFNAADPSAPAVLFYPVPIEPDQALRLFRRATTQNDDQALADLLGRSRATVLCSLADGCSTTELARRTGLSLAGASQHAAVLRNAGLVITRRDGAAVHHSLTALGHLLLDQSG